MVESYASGTNLDMTMEESLKTPNKTEDPSRNLDRANEESLQTPNKTEDPQLTENQQDALSLLSDRRKALFEPLDPPKDMKRKRPSAEMLLPPPDFDSMSYPRGWLIGKKRKLVNVDVVESMRRIAVQEMNRKDREIDGLNEQLEEDARCLEHLQLQLLQERSKRNNVERENLMLQNQISMLMNVLHEQDSEGMEDMPADDS
ncbi:protein HEADING DATE REPRESSOR 1-like isoform X2 [Tasmannia lanceolata]|uniref:protein HEADING DATE REPRESSOR 1-like isoform X2 n=1 Tax=Tasmannia lanceolata TaxID=3420 RepID=UPI0040636235